jgi:hypothetical protein
MLRTKVYLRQEILACRPPGGDPRHRNRDSPAYEVWPVFTMSSATFLQQDIPNSAETEAQYRANYKCDFWDTILTYPTT